MNAPSTSHAPDGNGTTNTTPDSIVKVPHDPAPMLYFRPETGEFILVPAEDVGTLQSECNLLHDRVDKFHKANEKLDVVLKAYADDVQNHMSDPRAGEAHKTAVDDALKERETAHKALKKELEPLSKLDSKDLTMVELIPIHIDGDGKKAVKFAKYKLHYVRSNKIKTSWHKFGPAAFEDMKGRKEEKETGAKSFIKTNAQGKRKIDVDKLKEGVLINRESSIKSQLYEKTKVSSEIVEKHVTGTLFAWAEEWNKDLSYSAGAEDPVERSEGGEGEKKEEKPKQTAFSNNVSIEAKAQLMRYLAGAGLDTEWQPQKGRVAIKASAQAEFAIAEGKVSGAFYYPDIAGWMWSLDGDDHKTYPLGAVRFKGELGLSGMVGASVVAQLGVVVDYRDEKRKDLGLYGASVDNPTTKQREIKVGGKPVDPSANADLDVFAGARADLSLEGSLEWMEPAKKGPSGKYKAFAKVGDTVTAMAGAGLTCMLDVSYAAGRFRIKAKAGLCLGVGAKGDIEVSVDALRIAEFVKWFFYQLYHANFQRLKFVETTAFNAFSHIQVMVIQGIQDLASTVDQEMDVINRLFTDLIEQYEKEAARVELMNRVLSNPWMLQYATPEAKGIMIYQLTRHWYATDGVDMANHTYGRWYGNRKDAVKQILKWSHTKHDLDNVVQHIHPQGRSGDIDLRRQQLKDFLQMSLTSAPAGDAKEMDDYYDSLQAMLKVDPTPGYAVAQVDTNDYQFQAAAGRHPFYDNMPEVRVV
ncbi:MULTISPECIES: hypothetical protein [Paraburkholderia]|uniref:ATPase n=2 Tax=Paraburkholderia TaxID=1822464 RepID=A0A7Y9WLA4_9BURK|nr:hypothetical protein [Paraburkholderia bryophila]NYH23024.1 hypothetical protein [Paraburkholderia bryophila]